MPSTPTLTGANRKPSARTDPWADPALFAYLRSALADITVNAKEVLAITWQNRFNEACSGSRIGDMLRGRRPLTEKEANRLLDVAGLHDAWTAHQVSPDFLTSLPGHFDYVAHGHGRIRQLDLHALLAAGISMDNVAQQLVDIDEGLFAHLGLPNFAGDPADWSKIAFDHPETWRVWMDEHGTILSYWMFVTPKPEFFRRGICGEYAERDIFPDTLQVMNRRDPICFFGPGVYVRRGVANNLKGSLGVLMMFSFAYQLRRLEHLGYTLGPICVGVWSQDGLNWAAGRFGLERMPIDICRRYAEHMQWPFDEDAVLPSIHYGEIGPELRRAAGLPPLRSLQTEKRIAAE